MIACEINGYLSPLFKRGHSCVNIPSNAWLYANVKHQPLVQAAGG